MEYTERYRELNSVFNSDLKEIRIPGSGISIFNEEFISDFNTNGLFNASDVSIKENISFSYPVFVPADKESHKVILLLHGLNERSWNKYLSWAYNLAEDTGSFVVLFPISFHINRSPVSWKDPRAMMRILSERSNSRSVPVMSSFANLALSRRLTEDPKRFLNSGYQTVCDIEKLALSIREGKHPVIPQGSRVDIFAYSIGAFLAEIILMGNPQELFSETRLFMFCGGSVFSSMRGTSKLIMDSVAYDRIYNYYLNEFESEIATGRSFLDMILSGRIGMAFRSMIDFGRFRAIREKSLSGLKNRIRSVGLLKDNVIPAADIVRTLDDGRGSLKGTAEVWDFPYPYTHENPFPVINTPQSNLVDKCYDKMMTEAVSFLSKD